MEETSTFQVSSSRPNTSFEMHPETSSNSPGVAEEEEEAEAEAE